MEGRLVFDPDGPRLEHRLRPYQIWQQEYAESSVESLQIGSREWMSLRMSSWAGVRVLRFWFQIVPDEQVKSNKVVSRREN